MKRMISSWYYQLALVDGRETDPMSPSVGSGLMKQAQKRPEKEKKVGVTGVRWRIECIARGEDGGRRRGWDRGSKFEIDAPRPADGQVLLGVRV
jgi:hypothetical protein